MGNYSMFTQTKYLFTGFFLLSLFSANIFAANDTTSALRGETNVGSATVECNSHPNWNYKNIII